MFVLCTENVNLSNSVSVLIIKCFAVSTVTTGVRMPSLGIDTAPQSFFHWWFDLMFIWFIALPMMRCSKSAQKSAVQVCQVATDFYGNHTAVVNKELNKVSLCQKQLHVVNVVNWWSYVILMVAVRFFRHTVVSSTKLCVNINTASCLTWRQLLSTVQDRRLAAGVINCCKRSATVGICCSQSLSVVLSRPFAVQNSCLYNTGVQCCLTTTAKHCGR